MAALANTPAAAAPAPAPGPAPAAVLSNESGAEDLARVMGYVAWVSLAGVQAAVLLRAGSRLSCAGSGEAVVAPVAIGVLIGLSFWGQSSSWGEEHATLRMPLHAQVAGVVVGFVAAALFASTHWHLGDSWVPTVAPVAGGGLATSGPYGLVRHPLYASVGLIAAFALLSRGWLLVAAGFAAVFAYAALVRVPAEEAAQARAHGDAWRAYVRRVPGALAPAWLWPAPPPPPQPQPPPSARGGLESEPLLRVAKAP